MAEPEPQGARLKRYRWGVGAVSVLAAVSFLLYATFSWRPPEVKPPLKIALGVWPGSETLVYARETGMLPDGEVQLVEMAWSSGAKVAFVNQVVDMAVISLDEVIRLLETQHDVRVVAVMGFSQGGDAILVRPGLKSVPDLKGRRVAVEGTSVGAYLLATALERDGVSADEVDAISMNLAEMESAFLSGEVESAVTGEPWSTRLLERGAVKVFDSSQMTREICRVLVARADVVENRNEDCKKLVMTHLQALAEIQTESDVKVPSLQVISRRLGVSPGDFLRMLDNMEVPSLEENRELLGGGNPGLEQVARSVAENMLRQGLLHDDVPRRGWLTTACLEGGRR